MTSSKKQQKNSNTINIIAIVVVVLLSMATALATTAAKSASLSSDVQINTNGIDEHHLEIKQCQDTDQAILITLAEMQVDIKYIKESVKKLEAK